MTFRAGSALVLIVLALLSPRQARAQAADSTASPPADTANQVPQKDVTDIIKALLGKEVQTEATRETKSGLSLTLLPSLGYNPAYGAFVGASIAIGGWIGDPKTTSLSSGSISGSYAFEGQISFQFKSDFFLPNNAWALKGDWRYLDTSQPTFGLGPTAAASPTEYPMDFKLYRLYQTVYKRIKQSDFYAGAGIHFDRYDEIHDERAEQGESTPFTEYSGGAPSRTQSVGLSVNVLADTRDNAINASRGVYWNASLRSFLHGLGSDTNRQSLWSDFRSYSVLPRKSNNVLAIWNYLWFTFGEAPYLDLPAIGWDTYGRSGRGFVQGHIRGVNQAYLEFEYRMQLTKNGLLGAVAFMSLTGTTQPQDASFGKTDIGFGIGSRIKFTKRTKTNLAIDAGRGQDNTTRMFFGLQEVF